MRDSLWTDLIDGCAQQHAFLDLFIRGWASDYAASGGTVHCRKGCSGCCSLVVNATFIEAAAIAREMTEEQLGAVRSYIGQLREKVGSVIELREYLGMHRREIGFCPFLSPDRSCGIYNRRPISCRSLLSTRENRWCSADFAALSSLEKQQFLVGLDRKVVAFPMHYVAVIQETGQELEAESNQRMHRKFGFSLYGNLPVLVFLAADFGLHEACTAGREEIEHIIASAGVGNPLLVTLTG